MSYGYLFGFFVMQLLFAVLLGYLIAKLFKDWNHMVVSGLATLGVALIGGLEAADIIVSVPIFILLYKKWIWVKDKDKKKQGKVAGR